MYNQEIKDFIKKTQIIKGVFLGLDIGSKRIGIAVSDRLRFIATPFTTLHRSYPIKDIANIMHIIVDFACVGIVIGMPIELSGRDGKACKIIEEFTEHIASQTTIPIMFFDERMSSAAVQRSLRLTSMTRKRREQVDDKMAASYILQNAMDLINNFITSETNAEY